MRTIGYVKSQIDDSLPVLEDTSSIFSTLVSNLTNIKQNLLSIKASLYNIGEAFSSSTLLKGNGDKLKNLSENITEEYVDELLSMLESHQQTVYEVRTALEDSLSEISQYDSDEDEEVIKE